MLRTFNLNFTASEGRALLAGHGLAATHVLPRESGAQWGAAARAKDFCGAKAEMRQTEESREEQMIPKTDRAAVRLRVSRTMRSVARLEAMTATYIRRGRVLPKGPELTRSQFAELYAAEARLLREELKGIVEAVTFGNER